MSSLGGVGASGEVKSKAGRDRTEPSGEKSRLVRCMQAVERVTMLLVVALSTGWVLYTSAPHGIGITPDSVHYLSTAQNLAKTGSLYTYTGKPLVSWAPLLPTLYAVGYVAGVQGETAAVVVNVVSFALILFVSGLWLSHFLRGAAFAAAMLALLLAKPVLFCALYAWSELPFVALTMGALYSVWRYVQSGRKRDWWIACGIGALCPLMRYIGTSVILSGALFLLVYPYQALRRRAWIATGYLLVTSLPLGLWLVRNEAVSGTLMGVREASDYALWDIFWDTLNTWHGWFVPVDFARSRTLLVLVLLVVYLYAAWLVAYSWREAPQPSHAALLLLLFFVSLYSLQLAGSAATVRFWYLDDRFWMPLAIPLAAIGSLMMRVKGLQRHSFILLAVVVLSMLAMGWFLSGARYVKAIAHRLSVERQLPGAINSPAWTHLEITRYLRLHKLDGITFTNASPELFYLTGMVSHSLPYKGALIVPEEQSPRKIGHFISWVREEWKHERRVYVVWVERNRVHFLYAPENLRRYFRVVRLARFSDGSVYLLKPLDAPSVQEEVS